MTANPGASATGLHHIGLVSSDLERSRDFYERILGLEMLGEGGVPVVRPGTVYQETGHWYGDSSGGGRPLVALRHDSAAPHGRPGLGGSHHFALAVASREVLLQWKRRFLDNGYAVNGILDRHYFESIYIKDPDGQIVELATLGPGWTIDEPEGLIGREHRAPPPEMINTNRDRARIAAENWPEAVPEISDAMRIRGLHHVTAIGENIRESHAFAADSLGLELVKQTNNFDDAASFHWYWGANQGKPGTLVTYFERRPEREPRAVPGAGQIAYYALSVPRGSLHQVREQLEQQGFASTDADNLQSNSQPMSAFATTDRDGHAVIVAEENRTSSNTGANARDS